MNKTQLGLRSLTGKVTGFCKLAILILPFLFAATTYAQTVALYSVGDSVTLTCTVQGTPPFAYTWFKNGVMIPVSGNPQMGIPANSSDFVFVVKADSAGIYTCTVTNPVGQATTVPANAVSIMVNSGAVLPPSNPKVTHKKTL